MDEVAGSLADRLVELSGTDGPVRLAPQAWALAMTDPDVRHYAKENIADLLGTCVLYTRRLIDAGHLPRDADATAVAKTLFGTLPGFLLQRLILEDITPDELRRGVRSLMGTAMANPQV
ncbi:TetR family transcriptional regulator C-terminal domain-containing protein [Spirillospora albida]|uniref:TetR family transcriptional regulator C-terminal domain-containing protein n=1 Tax=Spirillospora albida TaxID=58123 RepID=UPI00069225C3|nr:TetR family transcriptional regulator C-terminal domain-containing protein [Spirillospora albida]